MKTLNQITILENKDIKQIKITDCEFCQYPAEKKIGVQVDQNTFGHFNICRLHFEDYENREGVFELNY